MENPIELRLLKSTFNTYSVLNVTHNNLFISHGGNSNIGRNFNRKAEIKSWSDFEKNSPYSCDMEWLLECTKEGGISHFRKIFNILEERLGPFSAWEYRAGTHTEIIFKKCSV
jgi:hypothetical protein